MYTYKIKLWNHEGQETLLLQSKKVYNEQDLDNIIKDVVKEYVLENGIQHDTNIAIYELLGTHLYPYFEKYDLKTPIVKGETEYFSWYDEMGAFKYDAGDKEKELIRMVQNLRA